MPIAYSMLNVTATLDGRQVVGLADGDNAIQVAPGADVGTMMVGADGSTLFSQSADRSAMITLRLKPNSATHTQLVEKWRAQRIGILRGFIFNVNDSGTNEGGVATDCFIQTAPNIEKGFNATAREWVIVAGEWLPDVPNLNG